MYVRFLRCVFYRAFCRGILWMKGLMTMLYDIDFNKSDHPYHGLSRSKMGERLAELQRALERTDRSALVIINGWECSGKGFVLNDLVRELDPRYFEVRLFDTPSPRERAHTFLWRYMMELPRRGHIMFFDRSLYYELLRSSVHKDGLYDNYLADIAYFERLLVNDGTLVAKFFLHQPRDLMAERVLARRMELMRLTDSRKAYRSWCEHEAVQLAQYELLEEHFDKVLTATDFPDSPWHVVSMVNQKEGSRQVLGKMIDLLEAHLDKPDPSPVPLASFSDHPLNYLDMSLKVKKDIYNKRLEALQKRAGELLFNCYGAGIPVVVAFEGTDAAGKGGTIRRLTRLMSPRGYDVATVAAPTAEELSHHYLWRFYRDFPEAGMLTIFDRTWYGRVLVEKLEELTPAYRLLEAYDEIVGMEESLVRHGVVLLKFLLVISKEEQRRRFDERAADPAKQHKLTDEDWRNHEKYDAYLQAMNEMVARTNSAVPWHVIPSEDKRWARLAVLETFVQSLEAALNERCGGGICEWNPRTSNDKI